MSKKMSACATCCWKLCSTTRIRACGLKRYTCCSRYAQTEAFGMHCRSWRKTTRIPISACRPSRSWRSFRRLIEARGINKREDSRIETGYQIHKRFHDAAVRGSGTGDGHLSRWRQLDAGGDGESCRRQEPAGKDRRRCSASRRRRSEPDQLCDSQSLKLLFRRKSPPRVRAVQNQNLRKR